MEYWLTDERAMGLTLPPSSDSQTCRARSTSPARALVTRLLALAHLATVPVPVCL